MGGITTRRTATLQRTAELADSFGVTLRRGAYGSTDHEWAIRSSYGSGRTTDATAHRKAVSETPNQRLDAAHSGVTALAQGRKRRATGRARQAQR